MQNWTSKSQGLSFGIIPQPISKKKRSRCCIWPYMTPPGVKYKVNQQEHNYFDIFQISSYSQLSQAARPHKLFQPKVIFGDLVYWFLLYFSECEL